MKLRTPLIATTLAVAGLISGAAHAALAAQAALQGRDLNGSPGSFEAYYDPALNVTWLADANYAKTSGYDADGKMTWADANTWAANLSFTDGVKTYDNWRLPTVKPVNGVSFQYADSYDGSTDLGFNVSEQGSAYAGSTGSEMAHLFYNTLNNKGYCPVSSNCSPAPQPGWGLTNTGPFTNLQAGSYWSGTEFAPNTSHAWFFSFSETYQLTSPKNIGLYAFAVSPGDVYWTAAPIYPGDVPVVPEAQTYALMLAGLGLIGWRVRRRG